VTEEEENGQLVAQNDAPQAMPQGAATEGGIKAPATDDSGVSMDFPEGSAADVPPMEDEASKAPLSPAPTDVPAQAPSATMPAPSAAVPAPATADTATDQ